MPPRARSVARVLLAAGLAGALGLGALLAFSDHWRVDVARRVLLTPQLDLAALGDGGRAEDLVLCYPMGLAFDGAGGLLVSDRGRERSGRVVWRIGADGIARAFAGTGRVGRGEGRRADALDLDKPEGLAVAPDGSVYLSDGFLHVVFRIRPDGAVERAAGTGEPGHSGDGGPGAEARLWRPADIRLDAAGGLFIADVKNHRVRRLAPDGRIDTVAGTGEPGFSPDGTPAREARLDTPWGLGLDREGRLLIGDGANHRIRRVERDGRLTTLAGSGAQGYAGDGGPATRAQLDFPEAMAVAPDGTLYFGDEWNHALRAVTPDGRIASVMGTGEAGRAALGAPARGAPLDDPESVLVAPDGALLVSDGNNGRVLRIADGVVELLAGRGDVSLCTRRAIFRLWGAP